MRLPPYQNLSPDEQQRVIDYPLTDPARAGGSDGGTRPPAPPDDQDPDDQSGEGLEGCWRLLITGAPGTGKTVLAAYRADSYASRKPPLDVRLLTYGRLLRMFIRNAVEDLNLTNKQVITYALYMWGLFDRNPPQIRAFVYDWPEIMRRTGEGEIDSCRSLVVDEGQDLPNGFYLWAVATTDNLTVCADENQRIYEEQSTLAAIRTWMGNPPEIRLTKNYRNTRRIAELAAHFFTGLETGIPDLPEPRDFEPEILVRRFDSDVDYARYIAIHAGNNRDEEIGVFAPDPTAMWRVFYLLRDETDLEQGGRARDTWPKVLQIYNRPRDGRPPPEVRFDRPGVFLTHLLMAKGLEFDTVILTRLERFNKSLDDPETKRLLYVLCSRARNRLEFHYAGNNRPGIIGMLPEHLVRFEE